MGQHSLQSSFGWFLHRGMHVNPVDHLASGEAIQGPQEVLWVDPEHHRTETEPLAEQTDIDSSRGSAPRKPVDEVDFGPDHPVGTGLRLVNPTNDVFR